MGAMYSVTLPLLCGLYILYHVSVCWGLQNRQLFNLLLPYSQYISVSIFYLSTDTLYDTAFISNR